MIRANASRYPISAQCRILGVPRSTYYWMTGHPETEHVDPIAGDVRAVRRDSRGRYGARKIKAVLERKGVTASRRRIGGIMREQSMTSAYTRRRSKPHGMRADEARLANLLDRESDGYAPHARPAGDLTYVRVSGGGLGVRVPAGRPGGQGHRRTFRRAGPGHGPGAGRVRHARLPADGRPGVPHRTGQRSSARSSQSADGRPGVSHRTGAANSTTRGSTSCSTCSTSKDRCRARATPTTTPWSNRRTGC